MTEVKFAIKNSEYDWKAINNLIEGYFGETMKISSYNHIDFHNFFYNDENGEKFIQKFKQNYPLIKIEVFKTEEN